MDCIECGSRNSDFGKYCHNCGARLIQRVLSSPSSSPTHLSEDPSIRREQEALIEILQTNPKKNECHKCGSNADLTRYQFGMAKVLSTKREWSGTIGTAVASAISIALAPVIGGAVVGWHRPGKTVSYNVVKAELVLCRNCLKRVTNMWGQTILRDSDYRCHPWAEKASVVGYEVYLSADELAKLRPKTHQGR